MQTKYKMQPYERQQAVAIVKAYKAYKADVLSEEKSILSLSGGKYETIGDERAFQPQMIVVIKRHIVHSFRR